MSSSTLLNVISMSIFLFLGLCSFIAVCAGSFHHIIFIAMSLSMAYVFYTDENLGMSVKQYIKNKRIARRINKRV